ncbi:DoxX family protein [Martelella sp. HB161492]|uniref:DoxX family protein n=1 Tax=Martelella sp. HB161492 TaxID=2720726 RepID=UPI001591BB31|nr:DoxX family protein [Martelella sp. HB161492]
MKFLNAFEEAKGATPYGIFLMRLVLALYWGVHWCYKVIHQGMGATEHMFVGLGYPAWFAWGDITLEVIAVICMVLGLYVRTMSLALLVILVPALEVWIPNGIWAINGGYEFPMLWIFMQIVLAILGPGAFAMKTLKRFDAPAHALR